MTHMRKIVARTIRQKGFMNPAEAIRKGTQFHLRTRSILDDEVSARTICGIQWSDSALSLQLDDNRFLNFTASGSGITCAVDPHSVVILEHQDDVVLIEFERSIYEWHRKDIAERYVGKVINRLWFGEDGILVYTKGMPILACHPLKMLPDEIPIVFWTESQ